MMQVKLYIFIVNSVCYILYHTSGINIHVIGESK